jgi:hypothetical protein
MSAVSRRAATGALEKPLAGVPGPRSAIVMKLIAKTAEECDQTVSALDANLQRCFGLRETHGRVDPFMPGAHDLSDQWLIPEKRFAILSLGQTA